MLNLLDQPLSVATNHISEIISILLHINSGDQLVINEIQFCFRLFVLALGKVLRLVSPYFDTTWVYIIKRIALL